MAEVNLYGPSVEAFEYKDQQPTYWTEFLSWTISKNLENMQAAGFVLDDGQLSSADLDRLWSRQEDTIASLRTRLSTLSDTISATVGIVGGSTVLIDFCAALYNEGTSLKEMEKSTVNYYIRKRSIDVQCGLVQELEKNIATKDFWMWIGESIPEYLASIKDNYWTNEDRGIKKKSRAIALPVTALANIGTFFLSPPLAAALVATEIVAYVWPILNETVHDIKTEAVFDDIIAAFKKAFLNENEEGFLEEKIGALANIEGVTDLGFAKYYNKSRIVEY